MTTTVLLTDHAWPDDLVERGVLEAAVASAPGLRVVARLGVGLDNVVRVLRGEAPAHPCNQPGAAR